LSLAGVGAFIITFAYLGVRLIFFGLFLFALAEGLKLLEKNSESSESINKYNEAMYFYLQEIHKEISKEDRESVNE